MTDEELKELERLSKNTAPGGTLKEIAGAATKSEEDMPEEEADCKPKGERKFQCPNCQKSVKMTIEGAE